MGRRRKMSPIEKAVDTVLKRDPMDEVEKGLDPNIDLAVLRGGNPGGAFHDDDTFGARDWRQREQDIFLNMQLVGAETDALLMITGDTMHSNTIERYMSIVERVGFKTVMEVPFMDEDYNEKLVVMWNRGVLLCFTTYRGSINGGHFYYNWKPAKGVDIWEFTSSGHDTEDGVWVGDHDCREAFVHNYKQLKRHGVFLRKWVERPFLWLLTYEEEKGEFDREKINEERIALLPYEVRKAITPDE